MRIGERRQRDERDQALPRLFEEQVRRTPRRPAVLHGSREWTYQDLNRSANQLAHHLRGSGVGPDTLVGICVERSVEMLVGILGILKAGGAYVPLDPNYPRERLSFMMQDARGPVLVTQSSLVTELPSHEAMTICLDADWPSVASQCRENPLVELDGDSLAYVIYTSGSTGKPKGVQIRHRSLTNLLRSMRQQLEVTADDRFLALTSLSFDMAALELYLPLIVGAQVVIAGQEVASDGRRLREMLEAQPVTIMQATPATWRMLLATGWKGSRDLALLSAGEALPRDLAAQLLQNGAALWNLYGPTETTVFSTTHKVITPNGPVPIGRPIANTQVYILDDSCAPVPVGSEGELYIGGVGLARGYLNRPELTAERFVANPFGGLPGDRLYRTGDLARYLPDGNIVFVGRVDHQVKIRGFRVELGEVETVLRAHPAVCDAVVIARDDPTGGKRLVAYLVFKDPRLDGRAPSSHESLAAVRGFLKERLPRYMLPSAMISLDSLPLTSNGKVNRLALPAPEASRSAHAEPVVEPRDALELEIRQITERVLDVGPIGVTEDFFDLGGDSLSAVALMIAVEEKLGYELPLEVFLVRPTIETLANMVRERNDFRPVSPLVAIQAAGSRRPVFCVHGAGGVTFPVYDLGRQLGPDQPFYGLQDPSLDGKRQPCARVEALAAQYIEAIRLVQPAGPYVLAGLSFGGLVAFEMAQQLRHGGEEVAFLALLDTAAPVTGGPGVSPLKDRLAKLKRTTRFYASVWRYSWPYLVDNLYLALASGCHRGEEWGNKRPSWNRAGALWGNLLLSYIQSHSDLGRALPVSSRLHLNRQPRMRRSIQLLTVHERAGRRYRPQRLYDATITLFRSTEPSVVTEGYGDGVLGWSRFAGGGIEVHWIRGSNHFTLVRRPFVRELAEKLRTCLDALDRRPT